MQVDESLHDELPHVEGVAQALRLGPGGRLPIVLNDLRDLSVHLEQSSDTK